MACRHWSSRHSACWDHWHRQHWLVNLPLLPVCAPWVHLKILPDVIFCPVLALDFMQTEFKTPDTGIFSRVSSVVKDFTLGLCGRNKKNTFKFSSISRYIFLISDLSSPVLCLHLLYKGIKTAIDSVTAPCFVQHLGGETHSGVPVSVAELNYVFLFQGLSMCIHSH